VSVEGTTLNWETLRVHFMTPDLLRSSVRPSRTSLLSSPSTTLSPLGSCPAKPSLELRPRHERRICTNSIRLEHSGYFGKDYLYHDVRWKQAKSISTIPIRKAVYTAPKGRSLENFLQESRAILAGCSFQVRDLSIYFKRFCSIVVLQGTTGWVFTYNYERHLLQRSSD
jgi:hypothetical protein